jgi:hypothetical protein
MGVTKKNGRREKVKREGMKLWKEKKRGRKIKSGARMQ